MRIHAFCIAMVWVIAGSVPQAAAQAPAYPTKPVRMLVPSGEGRAIPDCGVAAAGAHDVEVWCVVAQFLEAANGRSPCSV